MHMVNQAGCTYFEGITETFNNSMTESECESHNGLDLDENVIGWFDGNLAGFQLVVSSVSMAAVSGSIVGGNAVDLAAAVSEGDAQILPVVQN